MLLKEDYRKLLDVINFVAAGYPFGYNRVLRYGMALWLRVCNDGEILVLDLKLRNFKLE